MSRIIRVAQIEIQVWELLTYSEIKCKSSKEIVSSSIKIGLRTEPRGPTNL